VIDTKNIIFYR